MHSEDVYLDEIKCDLLRSIRKRLYQQALKDGKEIKEYECSFEGVVIWPEKINLSAFNFGDGAVLGKTDQGHIGSLLLSEKRIRKVPQLTMDGAVSAVGLKRVFGQIIMSCIYWKDVRAMGRCPSVRIK